MVLKKIFAGKVTSILITLFVCFLWGSLYPCVKLGYDVFGIISTDIPSIMLFAGIRFVLSGLILTLIYAISQKGFKMPNKKELKYAFLTAIFATVLHYCFTYVALALGQGSKSAIIKQIGFLFLSGFAFLFDRTDKFSVSKLISGILGFLVIIVTSIDGTGFEFGIAEVLLIFASMCSVVGTIVSKEALKTLNPVRQLCISSFFGGIVLLLGGFSMGGEIKEVSPVSIGVLGYICFASIMAYTLWNVLLKYNPISKLSTIKFSETLFAVLLSGIILGENIFKLSYFIAVIFIFVAVLCNFSPKCFQNIFKKYMSVSPLA